MKHENIDTNSHNLNDSSIDSSLEENCKSKKDKEKKGEPKKKISGATLWTIKITLVTLVLGLFFSFISELTSSYAHVSITILLLFLLIAISIICDAIGIAATSCDLAPLLSMASRKVPGSKKAIALVKNAEKVSNICCDVIGDICGIISGACTVAIVAKLVIDNSTLNYWMSIIVSSLVGAITVGGKSFFKTIAMKNSKEILLLVSRILSVFSKKEK